MRKTRNSICCLIHPEIRLGVSECPFKHADAPRELLIWVNHKDGGQRKAVVVKYKKLLELIEKEVR